MSNYIRPLGPIARFGDLVLRPLMYLLAGTVWEAPQETHWWNNRSLSRTKIALLSKHKTVTSNGDPTATKRRLFWLVPRFHCPVFGGWRNYVAMEPAEYLDTWYIGWLTENVNEVSLLPIRGGVRALEGPGPVAWFGITETGREVELRLLGRGRIGEGGPFAHLPLR